jgi:2-oxoglutarate dehydrogenase E1 component
VAVIRLEELYPFPEASLAEIIARHRDAAWFWVQEEPRNMGGWQYVRDRFDRLGAGVIPAYVGRAESASTATGHQETHQGQQERLIREALG